MSKSKATRRPKKFKKGTVEIWYNDVLDTLRYMVDKKGAGEHSGMTPYSSDRWFVNVVPRSVIYESDRHDIYIGRI